MSEIAVMLAIPVLYFSKILVTSILLMNEILLFTKTHATSKQAN